MNLRMVIDPTQLRETPSNELTHMNRHSHTTAVKVDSKVAVVSAGRVSESPSAKVLQSSRRRRRRRVHHRISDLDGLSRLDAIRSAERRSKSVYRLCSRVAKTMYIYYSLHRPYSTKRMRPMFHLFFRNLCAHKISFVQHLTSIRIISESESFI